MLELTELQQFNPSLITNMETHPHPEQVLESYTDSKRMELKLMQYSDALKAYLHIERTILNTQLTNLKPKVLLQWIKEIHKLMAETVLRPYNTDAGEYSKSTMMEWQIESYLHEALIKYLSLGALESNVNDDLFVAQCLQEYPDTDTQELKIFLELIRWANEDTEIILSKSNKEAVSKASEAEGKKILPALFKLQALDLQGKLSTEQRSVLHGIITFFTPMEQIPGAMEEYAKKAASKFNACASNPEDLEAVLKFVAEVYDDFNRIHPFPCCNDQMALCLLNLFLVALRYPSILLCHPGDDEKDDSLYTRAMDDLDEHTRTLQELIESRILEATYSRVFIDKTMEKRIRDQFTILQKLQAMEQSEGQILRPEATRHGAFDATCNDREIADDIAKELARITGQNPWAFGNNPWQLGSNPLTFDDFVGDSTAHQPPAPTLPNHGANRFGFYFDQSPRLSDKEIVDRLKKISGFTDWKFDRVSLTATIKIPYFEIWVNRVKARLEEGPIARVHVEIEPERLMKSPRSCVIRCTNIDWELLEIEFKLLKEKYKPGVAGVAGAT